MCVIIIIPLIGKNNCNVENSVVKYKGKGENKYMYQLVAIDLDGTLLNSYGEVSQKNKEAIQKAVEKGVQVVLTSGRPIASVKSLALECGCGPYIICGNGAITYDIEKNEVIYNRFLEKAKVLQIIKICEENSIFYALYREDCIITKSLNYNILFFHQENTKKTEDKKVRINLMQNIYDYVKQNENQNYLKITICDENPIVFKSIMQKLKNVKNVDVLDVAHMSRKIIKDGTKDVLVEYHYTEITNQNVDKWGAIEDLAKRLNIKQEEIMAIGDNANDIEMIKNAGMGVAMGESNPIVKEIADRIVADNDHDGVAEALNFAI